ncbi:MAG: hypothetical protein HY527_01065 [Betaproteobacteria bacterium]|nr:hypothetical protein [Betaproteobacteria bacterium]
MTLPSVVRDGCAAAQPGAADLRWVQSQLGQASITLIADTYGHVQP